MKRIPALVALVTALVATRDHVAERIAAGRSLEEIHAEGLPDEWSSWAWDFIGENDWIGVLHAELSGDDRAFEYRDHGHAHGG